MAPPDPGPSVARDIPGTLGGSRFEDRPELREDLAAWRAALARTGPKLLEIGFDHGRRLSATAAANPAWTVIGLEVRERRVDAARAWAIEHNLPNLFAFRLDARAVLANATSPGAFDVVEALFPTPWPEGKARRRLLVTPDFLGDVARALRPGGLFYAATDVGWYAEAMTEAAALTVGLARVEVDVGLARRPPCGQRSRREWACERDGLPVFRHTLVAPA